MNLELILFICCKEATTDTGCWTRCRSHCLCLQQATHTGGEALIRVILHVGGQHNYAIVASS